MLREPTLEKLHALRLRILASTWLEQDKSPDTLALPFDDRLALLVDAETLARDNTRLTKNLRDAKLRIADACIEGIDFPRDRQLDKSVVRQLATCRWVSEHQTVIVTGATGTGKSYFACALAGHRHSTRPISSWFMLVFVMTPTSHTTIRIFNQGGERLPFHPGRDISAGLLRAIARDIGMDVREFVAKR